METDLGQSQKIGRTPPPAPVRSFIGGYHHVLCTTTTKIYNITEGIEIRALNGVSIDVKKGEFVSVMGPSGSGKTTLLNMIGALDNPSSGAVYINRTNY